MSIRLCISKWDREGHGLASYTRPTDNKNVWVVVPQSILGEVFEVSSLQKQGRGKYKPEISSILEASPCRVKPRCPHFATCGGCTWQHIDYQAQLDIKESWITSLFSTLVDSPSCIAPILGSDISYEYRNKMEFSFSQDKAGKRFLGLYGQYGKVVLLRECHLVRPWVSQTLQAVYEWWGESGLEAYHFRSNRGTLQNLTIRDSHTTQDRMVVLTVSGVPEWAPKKSNLEAFVECIKKIATPLEGDLSIVLRIRQIAPKTPTQIFNMILYGKDHIKERLTIDVQDKKALLDFNVGSESFFQPNTAQAQKIYSKALSMASIEETDTVFDLYCGIGIFGMFSSLYAQKAVGIELSKDAAYDATINSQRLGLGNFSVYSGDVKEVLESMKMEKLYPNNLKNWSFSDAERSRFDSEKTGPLLDIGAVFSESKMGCSMKEKTNSSGCLGIPDVVIVDPPRAGLSGAIENILLLRPKRLVYVSCNPETQAHDAQILLSQGWRISQIQPIDQFPQTTHVENCILFEH